MSAVRRLARLPLHPALFACYAVVFLWAQNLNKIDFGEVVLPLLVSLAGTLVVFAVLAAVLRDTTRAAFVTTLWAFLFFSYGHFADVLEGKSIGPLHLGDKVLLPLAALIAVGGGAAIVLKVKKRPHPATKAVNAIVAVLLLVSSSNVVWEIAAGSQGPAVARPGTTPQPLAKPKNAPDIYYFVLDRYAGAETLREHFGFDNTPFIEALRARGFILPERARGNYPKTPHSLATSLNMQYLDDLPESSNDWRKVYELLPSSRVVRFLKDRGYTYNYVTTKYHALQSEPLADRQVKYEAGTATWSGFSTALLDSTMLSAVASRLDIATLDERRQDYERMLYEYDVIPSAKTIPGPTYTFAHLYVGHDPYVFDAQGRYITKEQAEKLHWRKAYIDQIKYSNRRLLRLVDELLDVPAGEQPIILMQADEGPGPEGWSNTRPEHYDWTKAPQKTLEEKFRLMVAFHLPGADPDTVYPTITPVNNFRVIFNEYFGAGFDLLPDRSYVFRNELEPYRFIDVTDRVKD